MAEIQLFQITINQDLETPSETGSNLNTLGDSGSFEDVRANWGFTDTTGYTTTRSSDFSTAGTYSAKIVADITGAANAAMLPAISFTATSGNFYKIKCKIIGNESTPIADPSNYISISDLGQDTGFNLIKEDRLSIGDINASNSPYEIETIIEATTSKTFGEFDVKLSDQFFNATSRLIQGGILYIDQLEVYELTGVDGNFSAGSVLNLLLDDTDESIVIRNNSDDSLVTSGPTSLFPVGSTTSNPPYNGGQAVSNYSYCTGNDLTDWVHGVLFDFPYVQKRITVNSPICNGEVCSLGIVSTDVTNATDSLTQDGSITVLAEQLSSSVAAIQYNLNSDFNYGEGQASGTFSGLFAGNYTVFVTDENGCKTNVTLTILNQNVTAYGVKYRIGYKDINGNDARFDIHEKDYSGSITEVTSSGVPLIYSNIEKDQFDIFSEPIRASNVQVSLPETSKFLYRDLFTQDSRKYYGVWEKDTGAGFSELWRGYLTPNTFSSSYTYLPDINLTFIDQLNGLDRFEYTRGEALYGNEKIIKIIAKCLKNTNLELPIRSAINLYETSFSSAASDDPLDQAYIDQEAFLLDEDGDELNFRTTSNFTYPSSWYIKSKDCKEVINSVLKPFGAKILQWAGYWWIIRIEENKESSFDYREFDSNGNYSSNGSYSPQKYIKLPSQTDARFSWANQDQTYEIIGSPKDLRVNLDFYLRSSLLENDKFRYGSSGRYPPFWTFVKNSDSGTANYDLGNRRLNFSNNRYVEPQTGGGYVAASSKIVQIKGTDSFEFSLKYGVNKISSLVPYLNLKARIQIGNYYLAEGDYWTTDIVDYRFYPSVGDGEGEYSVKVPLEEIGAGTYPLQVRVYGYNPYVGDYGVANISNVETDGETSFRALSTNDLIIGAKRIVISDTIFRSNTIHFYTLEETTDAESLPNLLEPNDYNVTTNPVKWREETNIPLIFLSLAGSGLSTISVFPDSFYIDNVECIILPNGEKPPKDGFVSIPVNDTSEEDYEINLDIHDVPRNPSTGAILISSDQYIYNSIIRKASGNPTLKWAREGVPEQDLLHILLAKTIVRQYSTQTEKISGTLTGINYTTHTDLTPLDCLIETQDDNKIYYINGITINDKSNEYQVNLVNSKATDVDDGGGGEQFNGDFNGDFGGSFDTIYN